MQLSLEPYGGLYLQSHFRVLRASGLYCIDLHLPGPPRKALRVEPSLARKDGHDYIAVSTARTYICCSPPERWNGHSPQVYDCEYLCRAQPKILSSTILLINCSLGKTFRLPMGSPGLVQCQTASVSQLLQRLVPLVCSSLDEILSPPPSPWLGHAQSEFTSSS